VPPAAVFTKVDPSIPVCRDRISVRDFGRGILAVHRNARRLFSDGLLLLEKGRYPGALSMAILAHEEVAKQLTLGLLVTEPRPSPLIPGRWSRERVMTQLWADFENHTGKNATSLRLLEIVQKRAPDAKRRKDMADTLVRLRERSTYLDCVQGRERWSLPEVVVTRQEAVLFMRFVRKAIGYIMLPGETAGAHARNEWAARMCSPERLDALRAWSETAEAAELSQLDADEHQRWVVETDAALAQVMERT
jgi:AbiV family abortive infection protein